MWGMEVNRRIGEIQNTSERGQEQKIAIYLPGIKLEPSNSQKLNSRIE
jgi:hypothetical protein